jgi:hypothetical protein
MKNKLTEEEKAKIMRNLDAHQEKALRTGKMIIIIIASVNIFLSLTTNLLISFNLLPLIVQIALSFALIAGHIWTRNFFAVGAAINVIINIQLITATAAETELPAWAPVFSWTHLTYSLACCILLFTSKSIRGYMLYKRM